jgi:hypothetical protein
MHYYYLFQNPWVAPVYHLCTSLLARTSVVTTNTAHFRDSHLHMSFIYDQQYGLPITYMHVTSLRNKIPLTLWLSIIFQSSSSNPRTRFNITTCAEVDAPMKQNPDMVRQWSKMNATIVQV